MKTKRLIFVLCISILLAAGINTGCGCLGIRAPGYCTLSSFKGRVIDADTKEPVAGAAVLAVYYGGYNTVAGSVSYAVDAQEKLTDENGEFTIPEVEYWSEKVTGRPRANLTIFKPEYGVFPGHKNSNAVGVNKSWPPREKYIVYELPKLKTMEERKTNIYYASFRPDIPDKKMGVFLRLINEELISLGYSPLSISKQER
jgi:hypothetical protein